VHTFKTSGGGPTRETHEEYGRGKCDNQGSGLNVGGAIQANYCAYAALQADPLLAKLRASPQFGQLLSGAKECQRRFLPQQGGNPTPQNPEPDAH
jgi:hypothetical protein